VTLRVGKRIENQTTTDIVCISALSYRITHNSNPAQKLSSQQCLYIRPKLHHTYFTNVQTHSMIQYVSNITQKALQDALLC
jgi:hypothetical protein